MNIFTSQSMVGTKMGTKIEGSSTFPSKLKLSFKIKIKCCRLALQKFRPLISLNANKKNFNTNKYFDNVLDLIKKRN